MHISDGILTAPVYLGGFIAAGAVSGYAIRKMTAEELPKIAVITSVFFVASLIHIPIGPTSVHLILNGLAGVILGLAAFPCILLGLILQALLFQHGGITTIGVNTCVMGIPALFAAAIFKLRLRFLTKATYMDAIWGGVAGASAIMLSGILLALFLVTAGNEFIPVAKFALLAHLPIMAIEGLVTGFTVVFLAKVKPELLLTNRVLSEG